MAVKLEGAVGYSRTKLSHYSVYRTHDSDIDTFITGLEDLYRHSNKDNTCVKIVDTNIDTLQNNARADV